MPVPEIRGRLENHINTVNRPPTWTIHLQCHLTVPLYRCVYNNFNIIFCYKSFTFSLRIFPLHTASTWTSISPAKSSSSPVPTQVSVVAPFVLPAIVFFFFFD